MSLETGRAAPDAVPYDEMPAYRAVHEAVEAMRITAESFQPGSGPFALRLRENAVLTLLNTAEGGARIEPMRRARFYRRAWSGTRRLSEVLDSAQQNRAMPSELRFGPDAFIQMAKKALVIALSVMMERAKQGTPHERE